MAPFTFEDTPEAQRRRGGAPAVQATDYFLRMTEFRVWLRRAKQLVFGELPSKTAHRLFREFASEWNEGRLDRLYYRQGDVEELADDPSTRTRFHWGFTDRLTSEERNQLETLRDHVHDDAREVVRGRREPRKPKMRGEDVEEE